MDVNLIDAHCHADSQGFVALQRAHGVAAVVNAQSPQEFERVRGWGARCVSFGVHPWDAGTLMDGTLGAALTTAPDVGPGAGAGLAVGAGLHAGMATGANPATAHALELLRPLMPYYRGADAIGEIGLDREWTDVPLAAQLPVFRAQLRIAAALDKPVILHTKGAEREVLEEVRALRDHAGAGMLDSPCAQSPGRSRAHLHGHSRPRAPRIMVHWYDCANWMDDYIALGCWMTLGPDWDRHRSMRALAAAVPLDRLLIESDGLESIAWACPETAARMPVAQTAAARIPEAQTPDQAPSSRPSAKVPLDAYLPTLDHSLTALADLRGMDTTALAERLRANLRSFVTG